MLSMKHRKDEVQFGFVFILNIKEGDSREVNQAEKNQLGTWAGTPDSRITSQQAVPGEQSQPKKTLQTPPLLAPGCLLLPPILLLLPRIRAPVMEMELIQTQ